MYVWQRDGWPKFHWNSESMGPTVAAARFRQGKFLGLMEAAGFDARLQAELDATCEDVIKTSAIEGEVLNPGSVRSSIARRLGIPDGGLAPQDRKVEGIVEMILDAAKNFMSPLTPERIFGWHAGLFPTGYSGIEKIDVGQWRTDREGAMQVVSGIYSPKPKIHYEAPPAVRVHGEMAAFLEWFNCSSVNMDGLTRAGLAHLWYVTIHPLDDGNGRVARAIADLAVAQMERTGQRFYSMSSQIEREKGKYYDILERTQKGDLDITEWLSWFTDYYVRSIEAADALTAAVVNKAKFWHYMADLPPLSTRQQKVVGKLLEGFKGNITTDKWKSICGCSPDTAQRDINDMVERGLLVRNPGGGRSTSYSFNWPPRDTPEAASEHDGIKSQGNSVSSSPLKP
jgi:Fic family protein